MDEKKWKETLDSLNDEIMHACDGGVDLMTVATDGGHVGLMGSISEGESSERLTAALCELLCDPNVGLKVGRIVFGAVMFAAKTDPMYMSLMREFLEHEGARKDPPKTPQGGRRMPS